MEPIPELEHNKDSTKIWRIVEIALGLSSLSYFLLYPRNTLSDFVVCTSLCLLLILGGTKIGLHKPTHSPLSKADGLLALCSLTLFIIAWLYGFLKGKLTVDTALLSLGITLVYFYYAWIQHFLAQRYLALRLFELSAKSSANTHSKPSIAIKAALQTGLVFGVLHIPYPGLMLPAALGGFLYAYYFLITGRLWAVVSSHAVISSAGIYWFLDDNPFSELVLLFINP